MIECQHKCCGRLWKTRCSHELYLAIQDMYYGVTTSVSLRGKTNDFPLGIELHQGLALSL